MDFVSSCLRLFDQFWNPPPARTQGLESDAAHRLKPLWRTLIDNKSNGGFERAPDSYDSIFILLLGLVDLDNSALMSNSTTTHDINPKLVSEPLRDYNQKKPKMRRALTLAQLSSRKPKETYVEAQTAFSNGVLGRHVCVVAGIGGQQTKRIALVPEGTQIGDNICGIEEMHILFVVRKAGKHGNQATTESGSEKSFRTPASSPSEPPRTRKRATYRLVGECYVDGLMNGELLSSPDLSLDGQLGPVTFV